MLMRVVRQAGSPLAARQARNATAIVNTTTTRSGM
jgi:hypothetical protein